MKKFSLIIFLSFVFVFGLNTYSKADQVFSVLDVQSHLRSWKAGLSKEKIVLFANSVSDPANNNFVPIEYRRAIFDMDGTILCEKPFDGRFITSFILVLKIVSRSTIFIPVFNDQAIEND